MSNLATLRSLGINNSTLRTSVNSGVREAQKRKQATSDSKSGVDIFVASDEIAASVDFPTDSDDTQSTIETVEGIELDALANELVKIQTTLAENLRTVIGGAEYAVRKSDVDIIAETPSCYILHDHQKVIAEGLDQECKVTHTTIKAHAITVDKILDSKRVDPPEGPGPYWIIGKPPHWYDGQWAVIETLRDFIQSGVTPVGALDYWICSIMGVPIRYWSHVRNTSESAIYTRTRSAKETLEQENQQNEYFEYDYFNKVYKSEKIDGSEHITVDNGYLHPQRDISGPSATGHMISGYPGAGSKQLVIAILADAFDRETALKYKDRLNGEIHEIATKNDNGGWTLTEDDLLNWFVRNTN